MLIGIFKYNLSIFAMATDLDINNEINGLFERMSCLWWKLQKSSNKVFLKWRGLSKI